MSYGVVIPVIAEQFASLLRLLKSMRDRVTDHDQFDLLVVTNNDLEQDTLRSMLNSFVPGSAARVVSFDQVLRLQRVQPPTEMVANIFNRPHWLTNNQSLKVMATVANLSLDQVFTLSADSYVYREMSIWDDVINNYLQFPRHFSYVTTAAFLNDLIAGSASLLGVNRDVLTGYNYEYPDSIFEKDLFKGFLDHLAGVAGVNTYFEALHQIIFSSKGGGTFFETMAYRYYLERQKLAGDERLGAYMFLDSFDALMQVMPDATLSAFRPKEHPIERLCAWLRPTTFEGMQQFIRAFQLRMLRLERSYAQPWLVRKFLQETPEIKMLVGCQDYELYL